MGGDCWVIVRDRVYDVSGWERKHPGGLLPLLAMAGRDGTDAFEEYHPSYVWQKWLPRYEIGTVKDAENSNIDNRQRGLPIEEDRLAIREKFIADGLYKTRYSYFAKLVVWYALIGTAAVYVTLTAGRNWSSIILGSALMGLFWQQTAFLGHDLGHNGVFHDRQLDGISGVLFSSCAGISIAWWKRSHNVHHIVCNSIEHDPDIQHLPALCCDEKICEKPYWSTYHSKIFSMDAAARFIVSYQHYLFYPIMAFARFNLYLQGIILLIKEPKTVWKAH